MRTIAFRNCFGAALLCLAALTASPAISEDLVIQDVQGITRAASDVTPEGGNVEFSVVDASGGQATGTPVTLTNTATGEVVTGTAQNGSVVFTNVAPGTYTVASTGAVTFTNIEIVSLTAATLGTGVASLGTTALIVGGTGVVAGSAIAISNANDDNDDDDDGTPLSPSK